MKERKCLFCKKTLVGKHKVICSSCKRKVRKWADRGNKTIEILGKVIIFTLKIKKIVNEKSEHQ